MLMRRLRKWQSRIFVDRASADSTVFVAGMGRSGTTWVAALLNHDARSRVMFEPFNPVRVRAARPFKYVQYVDPESLDSPLTESARHILDGRIRGRWVDVDNHAFVLRRRIIKDVRCNLMLRWLSAVCPQMTVVLLIRHPLAVASSWLHLGWGHERAGSDFEIVVAQNALLERFPVLDDVLRRIDVDDPFERIVFLWCAFHLVPLTQFRDGHLAIVFYEDLLLDPFRELERLFAAVGRAYDASSLVPFITKPSHTDFLHRAARTDRRQLLDGWSSTLTPSRVARARDILAMARLDGLYPDGRPSHAFLTSVWPTGSVRAS